MSINRIQKLLFSEYSEFEDMVIVESPFAQTTREGKGIRQVHLGLTPTKFVLATDILPPANKSTVFYTPGIDPDIETFELIAVYPVECLNLSVFHRRKRQALKAHFCNNRILYFELGGFEKRNMFWNFWCERVKFLNPDDPGSSRSETSVATSTSNSTLYLLATRKIVTQTGIPQLWYKFAGRDASNPPKWPDRYLYLGKGLEEPSNSYQPIMLPPSLTQFVTTKSSPRTIMQKSVMEQPSSSYQRRCSINRFGYGISEGCNSGLFLPTIDSILDQKSSITTTQSSNNGFLFNSGSRPLLPKDYIDLTENAVLLWELAKDTNPNVFRQGRHRRRYGFAPQPHFLYGLGPWSVAPGERYSIQIKRAVSAVRIRRQPVEPELRLPISRRQLLTSISCEALHLDHRINANTTNIKTVLKRPVIFFWTPEYWYRPRSAKDAYHELLNHLNTVRQYCQIKSQTKKKGSKRRFFRREKSKIRYPKDLFFTDTEDQSEDYKHNNCYRKQKRGSRIFSSVIENLTKSSELEITRNPKETSLQFLKRTLKLEIALTAWDFDSTTLACQLTLIDRDLFLKIPSIEFGVLIWQQSSKNAPNIGALEAFSHRISCLFATEILRDDSDKIRARLIARLINTAEKCHKISNFQSCKSILSGLQSPAIYRLHKTWMYVRKRHATKYQTFEMLCRLYRDPRLPNYQKSFFRASRERPYLPYIGDIIAKLLNRVVSEEDNARTTLSSSSTRNQITASLEGVSSSSYSKYNSADAPQHSSKSTLKKILTTLKLLSSKNTNEMPTSKCNTSSDCITFHYEDHKIKLLNKAMVFLESSQRAAACYVLKQNEMANEYLLKARYREDRENFLNSFSVEKQYYSSSGYICNY